MSEFDDFVRKVGLEVKQCQKEATTPSVNRLMMRWVFCTEGPGSTKQITNSTKAYRSMKKKGPIYGPSLAENTVVHDRQCLKFPILLGDFWS
jgi:carbamoylphosphate synthase small subunit